MKLLVHIEQYNMVGILPSQLESLALLNTAMGITEAAYIDCTPDGFDGVSGFTRYASLDDFFAAEAGPYVAFTPDSADVDGLWITDKTWLMFGPAMGWDNFLLDEKDVVRASICSDVLCSRDAVPIALWRVAWQGQ